MQRCPGPGQPTAMGEIAVLRFGCEAGARARRLVECRIRGDRARIPGRPRAALSVVGIASTETNDFLLRTQGVGLVAAAGFLLATRDASVVQLRVVLLVLA